MKATSIVVHAVAVVLCSLGMSSIVLAQETAPTLDTLPQLGLDVLAGQAAAGDAGSALILGKLLADKVRGADNHASAIALLEQASAAGIIEASVRLADILRSGIAGVPADPARAAQLYELGASAGDNSARRSLAAMLLSGQGVTKNPARAANLLEAAAAAGNVDARLSLAGLYARGEGVAADPAKAIAFYSSGLADRNKSAITGLAALYRKGATGLAPAPDLAIGYYRVSAELGDVGGTKALADMMLRGEGTAPDADGAIAMLEVLAQQDAATFTTIGDYFSAGQVVPRDVERAVGYYEKAADQGVAGAMVRLGDIYRGGAGLVDIDAAKAFAYYSKAGEAGDLGALRKVADMQARGEGTPADLAAATATLEGAGDANSLIALGDLYSRSEVTSPDFTRATAYYQAAADAGNAAALVKLGDLYRNGATGLASDGKKAVAYYELAAQGGDNAARRALAAMLIDARLVAADPERAVTLLQAALDAGDAQSGIDLGNAYARGTLGEANYDLAIAAFDAAALKGSASASWRKWIAILNGPLAGEHGAKAVDALKQSAADNLPGVAVELARLQVNGKVAGEGAAEAVAVLAGAPNDPVAVRYLLQLYREGVKDQFPPDPDKAAEVLEAAAAILGPDSMRFERVLLNASDGNDASRYPAIAADFKALTRANGINALQKLRQINQNAYVYVVQQWMKDTGRYSGSLNGTLTAATIKAFNAVCAEAAASDICAKGPLSQEAARVISGFMYQPAKPAEASGA